MFLIQMRCVVNELSIGILGEQSSVSRSCNEISGIVFLPIRAKIGEQTRSLLALRLCGALLFLQASVSPPLILLSANLRCPAALLLLITNICLALFLLRPDLRRSASLLLRANLTHFARLILLITNLGRSLLLSSNLRCPASLLLCANFGRSAGLILLITHIVDALLLLRTNIGCFARLVLLITNITGPRLFSGTLQNLLTARRISDISAALSKLDTVYLVFRADFKRLFNEGLPSSLVTRGVLQDSFALTVQ